jgi:hypothetical protein
MGKMIKEARSRAISEQDKKNFAKYEPMFEKLRSGELMPRGSTNEDEIEQEQDKPKK